MPASIPVTVIGGYLGSGKTTLVNHLLRSANGRRLAIMVNEFGDLPIDEDLIEANGDEIISLAGGCVCCSYGNDLINAMNALGQLTPPPHNVLLETSGVALPGAVAGTISLLPDYTLDGIVVMVDAETIRVTATDKYMSDTIVRQLVDADLVVLNKTDLISERQVEDLRTWLLDLAESARLIEAQQSAIPPDVVLQNFVQVDHNYQSGSHSPNFATSEIPVEGPVNAIDFAQRLIKENPLLVRAKGFVTEISGLQKTIQIVGSRYNISDAPEGVKDSMVGIFKNSSDKTL